jgi:hypothetical protein
MIVDIDNSVSLGRSMLTTQLTLDWKWPSLWSHSNNDGRGSWQCKPTNNNKSKIWCGPPCTRMSPSHLSKSSCPIHWRNLTVPSFHLTLHPKVHPWNSKPLEHSTAGCTLALNPDTCSETSCLPRGNKCTVGMLCVTPLRISAWHAAGHAISWWILSACMWCSWRHVTNGVEHGEDHSNGGGEPMEKEQKDTQSMAGCGAGGQPVCCGEQMNGVRLLRQ